MSVVEQRAAEERVQAIKKLLDRADLRSTTKQTIRKIDSACHEIDRLSQAMSIRNVVRTLARLYPGDSPAESSIRNSTASGVAYRAVVDAWCIYAIAKAPVGRVPRAAPDPEMSDSMLNQIEPSSARMLVLSMRTALRNMRRQYQLLQSMTPEKLIRVEGGVGGNKDVGSATAKLRAEHAAVIVAFLDPQLCRARGVKWNDVGQLVLDDETPLSSPGLEDALRSVLKM